MDRVENNATEGKKKKKRVHVEEERVEEIAPEETELAPVESKKPKKKNRKNEEAPASEVEVELNNLPTSAVATTNVVVTGNSILSDELFTNLPICEETKRALQSLGFERMSHIQAKAIPEALAGKDVVGAAKTGSG